MLGSSVTVFRLPSVGPANEDVLITAELSENSSQNAADCSDVAAVLERALSPLFVTPREQNWDHFRPRRSVTLEQLC